ncbi:MAG: hypothetical protein HS113_04720 [Verrucomicrobiales bacterium]|nr:hypothetical protein [Verrucomicrobiales bacterium]
MRKFDPDSDFAQSIVDQVRSWQSAVSLQSKAQDQLGQLSRTTDEPGNQAAFDLVAAYTQTQQTNEAYAILDAWVGRPEADAGSLLRWQTRRPDRSYPG